MLITVQVPNQLCFNYENLATSECPKCSANPITVTPIWKQEFANGEHPIRGLYRIFIWFFFSNIHYHIKESKWGRKCISMNCANRNGSPQQIPLPQLPFANGKKHHYRCRAFWAMSIDYQPLCCKVFDGKHFYIRVSGIRW